MLGEDEKLGGDGGAGVEMDETYIGGKRKNGTGRPMAGDKQKIAVVGMVERKGRVRALVARDAGSATLLGMVKEHTLPSTTIFTDEWRGYDGIEHMKNPYTHRRIKHSEKIYVVGDIHTNTVEVFWSLIKRGIGGVYHSVSREYL